MYTLQEAKNDYSILAREYQQLSSLETLSFQQEERLSYIVDLALDAPALDERIQSIELSSLSESDRHEILNQQAKMREYLAIDCQRRLFAKHPESRSVQIELDRQILQQERKAK